ncbi:hypothetical protein CHLNCDRAFT_144381 [Chlorella variabilis]|uniref:MD-2-related lipid-recognition domain-containing protein n=1 Tax=Chlorella variabilis TaxID=554065 RepID=E1ZBB5_CHLVA|nr:hypothetical protein CHLNCDRAFT_144381 [Chlorella variabilis]EFN56615.1 hypothetical protein CHLNCDRAFT_144381 [Chlorella variabilis]|eukprot:XP_005848717.1 hypothetical protein CHLNCDRAFT_144381 [Chlorella variabilis]
MTAANNKVVATLLLAALLALHPATADWRTCDEGEFDVTGGDVEPYPVRAGEEVVFHVNVTSGAPITGGLLEVWVDYLGFHVYSSQGDLCEAVACPLAAGTHTLTFRQSLPKVAPPGPYLGVFQARNQGGILLFCIDINFRIAVWPA